MTYEAEQQIVKALRSLPWYMFLMLSRWIARTHAAYFGI
jgi:hypothetical protein